MRQIRARSLLYIPANTSAAACVSVAETTVPSFLGKLLFRAACAPTSTAVNPLILMFPLFAQLFSPPTRRFSAHAAAFPSSAYL